MKQKMIRPELDDCLYSNLPTCVLWSYFYWPIILKHTNKSYNISGSNAVLMLNMCKKKTMRITRLEGF